MSGVREKFAASCIQAFQKILLVRSGSLLLAVDQHAADERIRLEALQNLLCDALNNVNSPLQSIMVPAAPSRRQKSSPKQERVLSAQILSTPVGAQLTAGQAMKLSDAMVSVCT